MAPGVVGCETDRNACVCEHRIVRAVHEVELREADDGFQVAGVSSDRTFVVHAGASRVAVAPCQAAEAAMGERVVRVYAQRVLEQRARVAPYRHLRVRDDGESDDRGRRGAGQCLAAP